MDATAHPTPPPLIDSHVHLNFQQYDTDREQVAERWRAAGVVQMVHSCCTPEEFPQLQAVAAEFPEVFLAVGLHPLEAESWSPDRGDKIAHLAASDSRVVAIGETGLDYYYQSDPETLALQTEAFRAQIQVARELDLALIIHCRDAAADTLQILQEADPEQHLRVVMHCWSGTPEETRWFVERGCWISFSGIVTFKNAKTVQQSVLEVPVTRLLVETDCPFLAPVPRRGKRNEPAYVAYVAQKVADLRGESWDHLAKQTTENARQLFRLPVPEPTLG